MSDVPTETVCESCGHNGNGRSDYCPSCGEEDAWVEQALYDWDDVDLPIVFSEEKYDDHYGMWRTFCAQVFGVYGINKDDIENFPNNFPRMKYSVVEIYWKLTEDLKLRGPFLDESEAREA